ncbi:fimbrial protein [Providencia sp. Me31A]|uniref:fimbrial protein n=1 Tax=Providencia sp. Me31A TaxID=3392637 RepID=UPI003D2C6DAD
MRLSREFLRSLSYLLGSLLCVSVGFPAFAGLKDIGYRSVDNWQVDGQHGILHVKGALTDSPCRLVMSSADQTIMLGTVPVGDFPSIGTQGKATKFNIELTNCLAVENARMNRQTGQVPWSLDQPGFSMRFTAVDTDSSGRYVKLNGISGLGLMIKDNNGKTLKLGQYNDPSFLPAGQTILTYNVVPVRVPGPFSPGAFYAAIGFQLSYD